MKIMCVVCMLKGELARAENFVCMHCMYGGMCDIFGNSLSFMLIVVD